MSFATPNAPGTLAGLARHPVWALGFRPFYLLAASVAAGWIPLWLLHYQGLLPWTPPFDPVSWHAHEMLFGFAVAVLVGFLYTAIPNWTGLPTPQGGRLMALAALWVLGRIAMLAGGALPAWAVAVADVAFLPAAAAGMLPPLVRTRNRRNIAFPFALLLLAAGNLAMHALPDSRPAMLQAAIAILAVILVVMGGRVIPFFTGNRLPEAGVRRIRWLETAGTYLPPVALAASVLVPGAGWPGALLVAAGLVSLARQSVWGPVATLKLPILWILHVGYAWVGIGLVLMGIDRLGAPLFGAAATHALTTGAIGSLTVGMMARTALGHSGRMIHATPPIVVAFVLVNLGAVLRVFGPLVVPGLYVPLVVASGLAWSAAYALYLVEFFPILTRPRRDGRPG